MESPPSNVRDTGQECDSKASLEESDRIASYHQDNVGSFQLTGLSGSTPVVSEDKIGSLRQLPSLQSNDSGFYERTFCSTPASSSGGAPSASLISPATDFSSPLPPQPPKIMTLSDCDISPIHRKGVPARMIRRCRHSDPNLRTLAMRIQSMENSGSLWAKQSQSCLISGEREASWEIEKITSTTENFLKRNALADVLVRSRSCSRSLSIESDELEASLQEMSLEECSSSDSAGSPASPLSSSPKFTFPHSSGSRPQSPLSRSDNETYITVCDNQRSDTSEKVTLLDAASDLKSFSHKREHVFSGNERTVNKLSFAASLCLTPRVRIVDCCSVPLSPPLSNCTVIQDESADCDETLKLESSADLDSQEDNCHISESCPKSISLSSPCTSSSSSSSSNAFHAPAGSTSHQTESCPNCSDRTSICRSCLEPSSLKSPTKRTSSCHHRNTAISPLKMRKKMQHSLSVQSVKRDLMGSDLLSFQSTPCKAGLPSPQEKGNGNKGLLTHSPASSGSELEEDSSNSHQTLALTSSHNCLLQDATSSPISRHNSTSSPKIQSSADVQRVIESFSPPEPSRLIGRRIGVVRCDVIGELSSQNFLGCLESIFKYLSDADLVRVAHVSRVWRLSLDGDPTALHRYRKTRQAQRRLRVQIGKENSPVKLKDGWESGVVTAAKGPLCRVQPQQQAARPDCPQPDSQEADLMWDDRRRICPTCCGTALVHPAENRATCQRSSCAYVFCTLCFSSFHHPHPCKPLCPTASNTDLAGTRKSKKNLKRL